MSFLNVVRSSSRIDFVSVSRTPDLSAIMRQGDAIWPEENGIPLSLSAKRQSVQTKKASLMCWLPRSSGNRTLGYARTHPGADSVNFHDPRPQTGIIRPPVTELTSQNTDQVVVTVSDGMPLLFLSYLVHSVAPNESDKLRISISFNMMFSHYAEQLSGPLWGSTDDMLLAE